MPRLAIARFRRGRSIHETRNGCIRTQQKLERKVQFGSNQTWRDGNARIQPLKSSAEPPGVKLEIRVSSNSAAEHHQDKRRRCHRNRCSRGNPRHDFQTSPLPYCRKLFYLCLERHLPPLSQFAHLRFPIGLQRWCWRMEYPLSCAPGKSSVNSIELVDSLFLLYRAFRIATTSGSLQQLAYSLGTCN
jgi:hypothetical protein